MTNIQRQDYIKHVKLVAKDYRLPTTKMEGFVKQCYDEGLTVYQCVMAWLEQCKHQEPTR